MEFSQLKEYQKFNAISAFRHCTGLRLSRDEIFLYCYKHNIKFKNQGAIIDDNSINKIKTDYKIKIL